MSDENQKLVCAKCKYDFEKNKEKHDLLHMIKFDNNYHLICNKCFEDGKKETKFNSNTNNLLKSTKLVEKSNAAHQPKNLGEIFSEAMELASFPLEKHTIIAIQTDIRDLLQREIDEWGEITTLTTLETGAAIHALEKIGKGLLKKN